MSPIMRLNIFVCLLFQTSIFASDFLGIYKPIQYPASGEHPDRKVYLPTLKFESSYPFITASTFRQYADHILDAITPFDPRLVKCGDIIFVQIDFLGDFISQYRPQISEPYILLVHHFFGQSDDPVPGPHKSILDDPLLLGFFTHNADCVHKKLHPVPIGVGDRFYPFGKMSAFAEAFKKKHEHKQNCLMCFTLHKYRRQVYPLFLDKPFCTVMQPNVPLEQYLDILGDHKFTLSPRGNGEDCFRTWEALLVGTFPIVASTTLDSLYEDLPVVVIKDWTEVTEEFLAKKYTELTSRTDYKWEKLFIPYWVERMKKMQREARELKYGTAEVTGHTPIYICSAANANCFGALVQLIGSIHHSNFGQLGEITIFDVGLTNDQKNMLAGVKKLKIEQLTLPANLDFYAWRPHAIRQALNKYPYVLWLDIDTLVLGSLETLCAHVVENGYFLTRDGGKNTTPISAICSQFLSKELRFDVPERQWIKEAPIVATAIQGASAECTHGHIDPMCAVWYDMRFFSNDSMTGGSDQAMLSGLAYTSRMQVSIPDDIGTVQIDGGQIHIAWRPEDITPNTTLYVGHRDLGKVSFYAQQIRCRSALE